MSSRFKKLSRELGKLALALLVLGILGLGVAASGIIPITASSGHLPITKWFLSFSMRRSVKTHSMQIQPPSNLDDERLVLLGAGHYETGCAICHGSPVHNPPPIAQELTPEPPRLADAAPRWDDEELFFIVKHGVKMTGMPAFPSQQRDDEVWAVVAFLRKLPQFDARAYRDLAYGEAITESATLPNQEQLDEGMRHLVRQSCARCHGINGQGRDEGAFPSLAGQSREYLHASLLAYHQGVRESGIMQPAAASLSGEQMRALADYYANLEPRSAISSEDRSSIDRGRQLAEEGIPQRKLAACSGCHATSSDQKKNPRYPRLAGQSAEYLESQLHLFKNHHRGETEYAHLMRPVAEQMNDEQMRDVAAYYASLPGLPQVDSETKSD